ncbi:hypothetical protein [Polyangium aurulentum]|uniref:hypothetical protein n=1 Tax=Polyangium aurulentum TaxID=2567896 RepID=UPI0010ADBDE6|nr:hypothetical protein [Polyangium aurulentum]UQA62142.1 hypothetical protein E8A73_017390 [Polyangium aurulentum]
MRAIVRLVSAACLLLITARAGAQGITTNPKRPSSPAATGKKKPKQPDKPKPKQPDKPPKKEGEPDGKDGTPPAGQPPQAEAPQKVEPPPPPPPPKPEPTKLEIEIHGGAWLFYYQPFTVPNEREFVRLQVAHLNFDGSYGPVGLFFNASVRDTKMREFYDGTAWLEEGFFYYNSRYVTLKAGKTYSRLGLLWDNSFYGPIHFYDGIKLDPNYGLSAEGSVGLETGLRLGYYGQYFLVDGRTNGSYVGRDTISIPGARKRHALVGRVEPAYFWSKDYNVTLGLSGQYFQADLPEPVGPQDVYRFAADVSTNLGPVSLWAEVLHQMGQHVTEYPIETVPPTPPTDPGSPGRASASNTYFLAGGEVRFWKLAARYNLSGVRYGDLGISEIMHQPGIQANVNDYLQALLEFVYWEQSDAPNRRTALLDRSLNLTIHGYF